MLTEENRWRGGRVSCKGIFTYEDIARIKGVTVGTVRKAASYIVVKGKRRAPILDISDLESICRYLKTKRGPKKGYQKMKEGKEE